MKRKQKNTYMKTAHKLALLAAIALTAGGLITYAQSESSDPSAPPSGGPQGRPGPGTLLLSLLDKYDANHDGVLDQTELANLRSDIQAGKIVPPRHGGPGAPAGGNDASMHQPPSAKDLIKQFDTDNDGKLDEAELTAMLKFMHEHRPMHGPGGPGGQGGPGGPPPG